MASLPTLLAHEERRRDDEAALLHRAQQAAERAHEQARRLHAYRTEYQGRWSGQFRHGATIEILHCWRSFTQRLDQAIAQQARQVESAEGRLAQARAALLAQEQRCAAVRRLIERRAAELRRGAQQRDRKHSDEIAQRLHWQRQAAAVPQP